MPRRLRAGRENLGAEAAVTGNRDATRTPTRQKARRSPPPCRRCSRSSMRTCSPTTRSPRWRPSSKELVSLRGRIASPARVPVAAPVIQARYSSTRPGVETEATLVSPARFAVVSKGELTRCKFPGCPSGACIRLVLQDGLPGTLTVSTAPGEHPPSGAGASGKSCPPT